MVFTYNLSVIFCLIIIMYYNSILVGINMKIRYSALALLLASLVSACGGGSGGNSSTPTTPSNPGGGTTNPPSTGGGTGGEGPIANPTVSTTPIFQNISVHDPSVIKTSEGEYYVFGSHLSSAKTTDLIRWSRVADGVTDANPLFNTYAQQAAEGIAWTDDWVGSWAADVIQLEDGKYYDGIFTSFTGTKLDLGTD